ncbi:MAG: uroporphyrinogen-III synthase [Bacteroidota bacterium]
MVKRVFISRPLSEESAFRSLLAPYAVELIDQSLVVFHPLPIFQLPECEWIFFYSKNGVQYFFDQWTQPLAESICLGAIGKATAQALIQRGQKVDFVGSGHPEETALDFGQLAAGQRVLFPRASHSRRSVQQTLRGKIHILDLPVYRNQMRNDFDLPTCNILVFTSPLNAKAYFRKYNWEPSQTCVAIGATTAAALTQLTGQTPIVADRPTEAALAEKVIELIKAANLPT